VTYTGTTSTTFTGCVGTPATTAPVTVRNGYGGGTDGYGHVDPLVVFDNNTNAGTFAKTSGSHTLLFDCGGFQMTGAGNMSITTTSDGLINLHHTPGGSSAMTFLGMFRGTAPPSLVGSITNASGTTSYNTSSDRRLKRNITNYEDGLADVLRLLPRKFEFAVAPGIVQSGFIADEVDLVVPGAVTGQRDATDAAGFAVPQQMDYSKLIPAIVAAIQELAAKIRV
jgi:hypothetical protein